MGFVLIEGEGLLFFSLGVWIRKSEFSIEQPSRWLNPAFGVPFHISCDHQNNPGTYSCTFSGPGHFPILIFLHKIMVLSGLIACWFGLDPIVRWCMKRKWFVWLSAFSFMIYAMHAPLVAYCINPVLVLLGSLPASRLLAFFHSAHHHYCVLYNHRLPPADHSSESLRFTYRRQGHVAEIQFIEIPYFKSSDGHEFPPNLDSVQKKSLVTLCC